jgi:hypothetical protein
MVLPAAALSIDLAALGAQVDSAIWSAVCLERAKFELITCVSQPDWWPVALLCALAFGIAVVVGINLEAARRRQP